MANDKRGAKCKLATAQPVIIRAIKRGCTLKLAAKAAGVAESTLHAWLARGRKSTHGKYYDLVIAVEQARALQAEAMLERIEMHTRKDWKAAAWMLERVYGYHRDGIAENREEQTPAKLPNNLRDVLVQQTEQLQQALAKAGSAESWQAYAALQRQLLSVLQQIATLDANEVGEQDLTDEQIISEITSAILSMPPVLRQRVELSLSGLSNVVSITKGG